MEYKTPIIDEKDAEKKEISLTPAVLARIETQFLEQGLETEFGRIKSYVEGLWKKGKAAEEAKYRRKHRGKDPLPTEVPEVVPQKPVRVEAITSKSGNDATNTPPPPPPPPREP